MRAGRGKTPRDIGAGRTLDPSAQMHRFFVWNHQRSQGLRCLRVTAHGRRWVSRVLFLEEILERRTRVHGASGAGRGGFFFDPNPHGKKSALIALIFARDSLGDGLGAFEAAGSIEVRTLAAGVQFEAALRTFSHRFSDRSQQSAALRAAGNGMRSRHLQSARSESVFLGRLFARLLLAISIDTPLSVAVLIAVLAILLCHPGSCAAADIVSLRRKV